MTIIITKNNSKPTSGGGGSSSAVLPWLSLVAVIWLQAVIGTNTNFAAYSSQLKQYLSLSQFQLNDLAFASDAGKLFGWVSGIAADHLPLWLVLVIGSCLGFFSYGLQFLSLNAAVPSSSSSTNLWPSAWFRSYPVIFILNTIAGNSICWVNTVCYMVVSQSFPLDQQVVVGLTTSYQGLTTKIYAVVVNELFSSPSSSAVKSYLLLDSIFPLLVSGLALLLMSSSKKTTRNNTVALGGDRKRHRIEFMGLFVITTVTGICAVMSSLSSKVYNLFPYCGMVFTFGLLLAPLAIPAGVFIIKNYGRSGGGGIDEESDSSGDTSEEAEAAAEEKLVKEEVGVKVMLQRTEFWLYVFVYFLGPTIGIVYLNNLGQISESRRYYDTTSLVSLSSSFTFFGRLLPSFLDYFFSR
ncbi:Protein NUCLEAR FUSION DEFECTIVE 4 [Linum grandiflorum]